MATSKQPRLHNEVYPTIHPDKFKNALLSQVVVITGAAGTIGQAIAKCFANAGSTVYLLDFNVESLDRLKATCLKLGAKAAFSAQCDVSDYEKCEAVIEKVKVEAGPIDVLVNNAGVLRMGVLHLQDPKWFSRSMEVNVYGPYNLMRLVLPDFLARRRGCIINMASRSGTVAFPLLSDYTTSKAALIHLTACVQAEVDMYKAEDVHLYALHPGGVVSNMAGHTPVDPSVNQEFPEVLAQSKEWAKKFKGSPYIPAMVCVALATGIAKEVLRGRYFDCEQDITDVLDQREFFDKDPELNRLAVKFLGGLPNDGGMEHRAAEEPVKLFGDWE